MDDVSKELIERISNGAANYAATDKEMLLELAATQWGHADAIYLQNRPTIWGNKGRIREAVEDVARIVKENYPTIRDITVPYIATELVKYLMSYNGFEVQPEYEPALEMIVQLIYENVKDSL